jgi:hypothetical protein
MLKKPRTAGARKAKRHRRISLKFDAAFMTRYSSLAAQESRLVDAISARKAESESRRKRRSVGKLVG